MEKKSKHYGDIEKWVEKVIDSCETSEQLFSVRKLVTNFDRQMCQNNVNPGLRRNIVEYLRFLISSKLNTIIYK